MHDSLLTYFQWMLPLLGLRGDLPGPVRPGEPPGLGGAPAAARAAQGGRHLQGGGHEAARGGEQAAAADAEPGSHVRGDRVMLRRSARSH